MKPNVDIFFQGGGSEAGMTRNEPYSDDLAGFSMEALQPAAGGGAKLTKDQILAGFGQGLFDFFQVLTLAFSVFIIIINLRDDNSQFNTAIARLCIISSSCRLYQLYINY